MLAAAAAAAAVEGGWLLFSDSFLVFTSGVGGRSCSCECFTMYVEGSCLECAFWGGRAGLAWKNVFFAREGGNEASFGGKSRFCMYCSNFFQYLMMLYFCFF